MLTGKQTAVSTRDLRGDEGSTATGKPSGLDTGEASAIKSAGTGVFTDKMVLRIEIEGGTTPILLHPEEREMSIGRRDPTTGAMPDVDLTPYAGYRMGVSRRHVALKLRNQRLDVWDLGSSNGTYLNGVRMTAYQPHQIHDGDEMRLGQMVLRFYFQETED
jgi:pSer/pThr/pTyr-binding forkhead associated (FHA) protein